MPDKCTAMSPPGGPSNTLPLVARCGGSMSFSIFVMDWRVHISEQGDGAKVELSREVNWFGGAPRPLPDATD
jgi:hypothetical protein